MKNHWLKEKTEKTESDDVAYFERKCLQASVQEMEEKLKLLRDKELELQASITIREKYKENEEKLKELRFRGVMKFRARELDALECTLFDEYEEKLKYLKDYMTEMVDEFFESRLKVLWEEALKGSKNYDKYQAMAKSNMKSAKTLIENIVKKEIDEHIQANPALSKPKSSESLIAPLKNAFAKNAYYSTSHRSHEMTQACEKANVKPRVVSGSAYGFDKLLQTPKPATASSGKPSPTRASVTKLKKIIGTDMLVKDGAVWTEIPKQTTIKKQEEIVDVPFTWYKDYIGDPYRIKANGERVYGPQKWDDTVWVKAGSKSTCTIAAIQTTKNGLVKKIFVKGEGWKDAAALKDPI